MNLSKVVTAVEKGVRVAERIGAAALGTELTHLAVPSLLEGGGVNAQVWKAVFTTAVWAAIHAEAGTFVAWLRKKWPAAAPVVQAAEQAAEQAAGGSAQP